MFHLIEAVEKSLDAQNWDSALFVAINLPDICAKLEGIQKKGKTNGYVLWTRRWVQPLYTMSRTRSVRDAARHMIAAGGDREIWESLLKETENAKGEEKETVFMTAEDLYALRCAFTHSGEHHLSNQTINQTLSSFQITAPNPNGTVVHNNYFAKLCPDGKIVSSLQVQVDMLCRDICAAVNSWLAENSENSSLMEKISLMPKIAPIQQC